MAKIFPRAPVTFLTAAGPEFAIVRHPRRGAVENSDELFIAPRLPLCLGPSIAFERLLYQPIGLGAIAPSPKRETAKRRRHRAQRRRQAMVNVQGETTHDTITRPGSATPGASEGVEPAVRPS